MYRTTSPAVFEMPEVPTTLRRVKPLPKRRRMGGEGEGEGEEVVVVGGMATGRLRTAAADIGATPRTINGTAMAAMAHNVGISATAMARATMMTTTTTTAVARTYPMLHDGFLDGLELPGPEATAEELLAHAEELSARMAMGGYYVPVLSGGGGGAAYHASPPPPPPPPQGVPGYVDVLRWRGEDEDAGEGDGEGDYVDHLQQPGNTKKRKVPANAGAGFGRGHGAGADGGGGEHYEVGDGDGVGRSGGEHVVDDVYQPRYLAGGAGGGVNVLVGRRGKLTAATLAGLQHKEMLKTRKRQLAAVLGALSVGDTLALDQALSGGGFEDGGGGGDLHRVRLSKRRVVRLARAARRLPRHPDQVPFPVAKFTFACPSATADRLIATKEEVTMLRNRFQAELARQAAKAAKAAAANRMMSSTTSSHSKGRSTKRAERERTRTARGGEPVPEIQQQQLQEALVPALTGVKAKASKKKKRSALANASNPHHLRNYVPSRLPSQGAASQASANAQNALWPPPVRFLSAEIAPRRGKKSATAAGAGVGGGGGAQLTNPGDEWVCAFCEYALFYGEEVGYRRAVRNRKKILKRRRRAKERAAAAAGGSGNGSVAAKVPAGKEQEEYEGAGYEGAGGGGVDEFGTVPKQTKWKGDPNRDRGGGGGGEQGGYG